MIAKKTSQDHKTSQQYWVIKTTEGGRQDRDHWKEFQTEKVIAVGWEYIQDDPTKFSGDQEFFEHLASKHDRNAKLKRDASNVYKFATELQIGDIVIICRGYAPNQKKDVYLYGFAQIAGEYFRDEGSKWWKNKIKADIKTIERDIPLNIFVDIFGGAMRKTLHGPLEEEKIRKFSKEVEKLYPELWHGVTTSYPIKFADTYKISEDRFSLPEEIDIAEVSTLYEGAVRQISVNDYERNPKARQLCIGHYGTRCRICDFDFKEMYGEIGEGLIHVHHLRQLSDVGKEYEIDPVNDLCPVCPNCHTILHRRKPPYTFEEIRGFIDEQKKRRC
jgi:predicted HNH restriction endonuclease